MPRVFSSSVAAGQAAQVSIDRGIVHPRGTAVCWLTSTRLLFNALISAPGDPEVWQLRTYDVMTGALGEVPNGSRGANAIAAGGGGKWFAWLDRFGVYDAAGNVWSGAGLAGPTVSGDGRGAAGRDGSLAMVTDRGNGRGLLLYPPSGPAITLPDIAIGKLTIESASVVCWTENNQVVAWGTPTQPAPQLDPVFSAQSLWTGRERLLLVTGYDRLWLRKWSEAIGYLVVPTPTAFSADAVALSPDLIRVSWSTTAGEAPGDIAWLDIAVADLVQPVEPPTPPDPPDPGPPDPPVVAIVSYVPTSGIAPLTVAASYVRDAASGPIDDLHWQRRAPGAEWFDDAINPASDPDHHYALADPGAYELRLVAVGPGGSDATGVQSISVTASDPQPEPEPEPEPEPPLPEEPLMLTVDLTTPLLRGVSGDKVDNDDGTVSVKCPDGYLSIDSSGAISFKPEIGSDEKFAFSGSALIATNTFDGVKTWIVPCVES